MSLSSFSYEPGRFRISSVLIPAVMARGLPERVPAWGKRGREGGREGGRIGVNRKTNVREIGRKGGREGGKGGCYDEEGKK